MNHKQARSLFMDYLYDEIETTERQRLERYMEQHPELSKEFEELRATRKLFGRIPRVKPKRQLFMVEPADRTFSQRVREANRLTRFTMAVAAGLVLLLFLGSLSRLHIDVFETGFSVSLGYKPTINEGITDQQMQMFISQVQEQNAEFVTEYLETTRRENRQQIMQLMEYVLQQRENDLQMINNDLDQIQQVNSYRWQQTNQLMGDFLERINYQELN